MKRTKGSQSETGMLYQYGVTTLLAAELSGNSDVDDYIIYSSENSAGKFDDVVARIKLKDQDEWYLTLIQVKYKETKRLNVSDNLKGKKIDYFISDYIHCFDEILGNPELTCRQAIPQSNIRFAIFCDKSIQMPVFLRQDCTFQLKVYPYFEKSNTLNNTLLPFGNRYWKFACEDLEKSEHQQFFDRCCLYLEQPNYNKLNELIKKACEIHSAKEIVNYVKDYFNDDYLYKQGLRKDVFEIELQNIRFSEAIPPLISLEDFADDAQVAIFNEIILQHDITLINYTQNVLIESYLYKCVVQRLNTLLDIDTDWKMHISKNNYIDREITERFIAHSKTKKFRYWLDPPHTLKLLIIELWKCGDLPLILKTHTKLSSFERYAHLTRNYVIIDDWTNRSDEVSASKLNIFSCLSSISNRELQDMMLQNILVSFQGRKPVTLKNLLVDDKELMSTFACTNILHMMRKRTPFIKEDYRRGSNYLAFIIEDDECTEISKVIEPYVIGHSITISCPSGKIKESIQIIRGHPIISQHYTIYQLRRFDQKLFLTEGDPDKLSHCFVDQYGDPLFISNNEESIPVIGQPTKLNELQYIRRQLRRATLPRWFFNMQKTQICLISGDLDSIEGDLQFSNADDIKNKKITIKKKTYFIKITKKEKRQDYWCTLCRLGYPIFDIYVKDNKLNLIRFQHCENLEQHISYNGNISSESDFFDQIRDEANEITVVTGDAGIGKTSFLKWMCNNYSTTNYIISYDLINLQIDSNKSKIHHINIIDFIFKEIQKSLQKEYTNFVCTLWRMNKIIWILDSFDEIRLACEKEVLDFIRLIGNSGAQIIIATRTENCKILMDEFGVRLIKIDPLEEDECRTYWQLNEDLLENVPSELLTNPLYLNFLKMISADPKQLKNITKYTLYEKVINMKIRDCLQRTYRVLYDSEVERTVSLFEKLALVAMFGKDIVGQELYWTIDHEISDITKFGIIIRFDEGGYPIFYHRTFVEFLVAYWITKAHQIRVYKSTAKYLYRQIFYENKLHILNILFEDVELHRAILQSPTINRIEDILTEDPKCWDTVDKLGRTVLHAAVINCLCSKSLSANYRRLEFIITSMLDNGYDVDNRDTIMNWNSYEYVTPDVFEFACVFEKIEIVKIYLHLHRRTIEKNNSSTTVFPTKYFHMLFCKAINLSSIDMIADLVWLQNLHNTMFQNFYRACLGSVPNKIALWTNNFRFEGQLTLMHVACIYGKISMIQHLIKVGVDVNAIDDFTRTPLHYSVMRCSLLRSENVSNINEKLVSKISENEDAVKFLLNAGAKPESLIIATGLETPLWLAVRTMNTNVVKMLLEAGADSGHSRKGKDTLLHFAVRIGNLEIVRCLLNYKAPRLVKNEHGETAMDIAVKQDRKEIIDLLSDTKDTADAGKQAEYVNEKFRQILKGTPLHDAVLSGNINMLKILINEGGDINLPNKDGLTPLHVALYINFAAAIRLLLSNGANVDVPDKFGLTPLYLTTLTCNINVMEMILEKGANPNIANWIGETPLFKTVLANNCNAVTVLLKRGANVNVQCILNDNTPLYVAAKIGNIDIIKLLLVNGADTEISCKEGNTPLQMSIWFRHKRISKLLLQNGANANADNKQGRTPFLLAVIQGDIEMIRLLLKKGARVNTEDVDGYTALHVAANSGNMKIVKLLLEKGANANAQNKDGESPLFLAAEKKQIHIVVLLLEANVNIDRKCGTIVLCLGAQTGDNNIVKLLLSKGIDVNVCDENGCTPLHLAVENGHTVTVNILLEQGARVNAYSKFGSTPLQFAVENEHENLVKLLIDKGADINAKNKDALTPVLLAIETRNINILKVLLQANATVDAIIGIVALYFAVCLADINIVKLLLDRDIKMNTNSIHGYTLLYIATVKGRADIIRMLLADTDEVESFLESPQRTTKLLLSKCTIVNVLVDILGSTALHLKIAEGHVDFVKLLVEEGADVNIRTKEGKNPLEIAVDCEYASIVDVLLEGGADINAPTSNNDSIVRLAALKGNATLVGLLLNKGASIITNSTQRTTLLHDCARTGNVNIMKMLLERKIDLNIRNNIGNTALHIGVIEENENVVSLLLSKSANTDIANYKGKTPFQLAVRKVCEYIVGFKRTKKRKKANINSAISYYKGKTHFHLGVRKVYGYTACSKKATKRKKRNFNPDIMNYKGNTPFHLVVRKVYANSTSSKKVKKRKMRNVRIIWSLLENMKHISFDDQNMFRIFYWAAENKQTKIINLLLNNGMNVNVQDQNDYTVLHIAVINENQELVEMLLRRGADVHLKTDDGFTILDFAKLKGNQNILKIITRYTEVS